jgi:hypothetical protein
MVVLDGTGFFGAGTDGQRGIVVALREVLEPGVMMDGEAGVEAEVVTTASRRCCVRFESVRTSFFTGFAIVESKVRPGGEGKELILVGWFEWLVRQVK